MFSLKLLTQTRVRPSTAGFSLVEMLTVIAIATVLASLSFPALSGIQGAKLSDSISELSDYMKQAQTLARASNSYVWIGFAQNSNGLEAVTLQGLTGVSSDLPGQVRQASRPLYLPNVVLDSGGLLPTLSQAPATGSSMVSSLSQSKLGTFSYTVGGSTNKTFSNVIGITPRGEAFLAGPTTMVHWVQIGLAPYPYNSTSGQMPNGKAPNNFGEIFMAGLTGEVDIVRP